MLSEIKNQMFIINFQKIKNKKYFILSASDVKCSRYSKNVLLFEAYRELYVMALET